MSSIILFAVIFAIPAWIIVFRPIILLFSPSADALRIKRDLEGNGNFVVKIERAGSARGAKYSTVYRRYLVTISNGEGANKKLEALVSFSPLSDKELLIFPL